MFLAKFTHPRGCTILRVIKDSLVLYSIVERGTTLVLLKPIFGLFLAKKRHLI